MDVPVANFCPSRWPGWRPGNRGSAGVVQEPDQVARPDSPISAAYGPVTPWPRSAKSRAA